MKNLALFESHTSLGARFVKFADWNMPFSYTSPKEEHLNTRKHGSLFDVSHMGQIRIKGQGSLAPLQNVLPTQISHLKSGQACYSVLCSKKGGLLDDIIVYVIEPDKDYLLCVNAGHKDKVFSWLSSQIPTEMLVDASPYWAMIAVQGPLSFTLFKKIFTADIDKLAPFEFCFDEDRIVSLTGYTGEQGFEIYVPTKKVCEIWSKFLEEGQKLGIKPAGLGARDTLRLEMKYLLAGQDFDETKTPVDAGLSWLLTNKGDYIGKPYHKAGAMELRAFTLSDPAAGVPRNSYKVLSQKNLPIGFVTSGAKSPSLEKMIGLAYIERGEQEAFVDLHGSSYKMTWVQGPFLKKGEQE